ncbi:unnamed protein product [Rodentolepis nana]|uniref:Uncharacterized protein n=1 Tax=Rodentolepis nana TaxID=102285 RepID=A0A3P7S3M1_RODNA|nr:unnamed protein product [Rodentolepis nana]
MCILRGRTASCGVAVWGYARRVRPACCAWGGWHHMSGAARALQWRCQRVRPSGLKRLGKLVNHRHDRDRGLELFPVNLRKDHYTFQYTQAGTHSSMCPASTAAASAAVGVATAMAITDGDSDACGTELVVVSVSRYALALLPSTYAVNGWRQAASPEDSADWDVVYARLVRREAGVRCLAVHSSLGSGARSMCACSVHFLRGEHHDRWDCQSAASKSCPPDYLVCWVGAIAGGMGERRSGTSVLPRVIVHSPLAPEFSTSFNMVLGTHVIGAVESGCAAVCLVLGLTVVLPAQSGSGGGFDAGQLCSVLRVSGVCSAGGEIVSGAVVDELPDPS